MRFSEFEMKKMFGKKNLCLEDHITANILGFIHTIHLNGQNFINSTFESEYFGNLPMTFRKESGQVVGLITATIHGETRRFIFTEHGFECLDDLLRL
ncbi:hypothetical protein SDC9_102730 [bioreactor metagenome]|uniref:Uncharacterized protein n=1 Tax=bioreactor metagenome TaxID=1076179 RepID=A0A645ARM9_9ZZZZ